MKEVWTYGLKITFSSIPSKNKLVGKIHALGKAMNNLFFEMSQLGGRLIQYEKF